MANVNISTINLQEGVLARYNAEISDFVKEQKNLLGHLKNFTKYVNVIVPNKETEMRYYQEFASFLSQYEENQDKSNVSLGGVKSVRLVSGETQGNLKQKLEALSKEMSNPFIHIRNWVKGETYNLGALIAAIAEKESCDVRKGNAIKKLNSDRETVHKLSEGKFSIKHVFKSDSAKVKAQTQLLEKINQTEKDIENWDVIKKFLTIYLAEVAIPQFRQSKQIKYITAMQNFSGAECDNAKQTTRCWGDFYDMVKTFDNQ